jgi:hypothetical protein
MAGTAGEIRAKEARVQLTVDSVRLGGSFSTIHDISVKPDATIAKKRFTGEQRARGDLDIVGWDISFKSEKRDHLWMDLWDKIQSAEFNAQPLPDITMTLTYRYRDGSNLLRTTSLGGDMVLKLDEDSIPKDGYQGNSWTGFCSYNSSARSG